MNKPSIYLAGKISGLSFDESEAWRNEFKAIVGNAFRCFSPLRGKTGLRDVGVIEQSYTTALSCDRGILCRDHLDCMTADMIVCNFQNTARVSIGSVMECAWAFAYRKPLLVITDHNTVHDHPMIRQVTDFTCGSVDDAALLALSILQP
jgi:nucleoside 2-deoxyribosyltransferase